VRRPSSSTSASFIASGTPAGTEYCRDMGSGGRIKPMLVLALGRLARLLLGGDSSCDEDGGAAEWPITAKGADELVTARGSRTTFGFKWLLTPKEEPLKSLLLLSSLKRASLVVDGHAQQWNKYNNNNIYVDEFYEQERKRSKHFQ